MPESPANHDQTLERPDNQIRWYDIHGSRQRRSFYSLKIVTVVAAATIPLLAVILPDGHLNKIATSSLGALIVVIKESSSFFNCRPTGLFIGQRARASKAKSIYIWKRQAPTPQPKLLTHSLPSG